MGYRVLLDTNVVLIGALASQSLAGQLWKNKENITFIVPNLTIEEARRVIQNNALHSDIGIASQVLIEHYLNKIRAIVTRDTEIGNDFDKMIYSIALKNGCDCICTYNIKHFLSDKIKILSPLGLIKEKGGSELNDFLPFYWFGEESTVLFRGILYHPSSLGEIIISDNGIKVYADENGFIRVTGKAVENCDIVYSLPTNAYQSVCLIFRYKKNFFEARNWFFNKQEWIILSRGKAAFGLPISPRLGVEGKTSAIINDFSAIPLFIKNKNLSFVIQNGCLESFIGSIGIFELLRRIKIEKISYDEWKVSF